MTAADVDSIASARTLLFVPGDRPERFVNAEASGADGIVLDLEDAVGPDRKAEARENVRRWRAVGGPGLVRINGSNSPRYRQDVASLCDGPCAVMLPKAVSRAQVVDLMSRLPAGSCVVPILESAAGVLDARAVCATPGVVRAAFGNADLPSELGIDHTDQAALAHARCEIVLASAASGVAPPLDGVTTTVGDEHALLADTEHAAALGFTGKLCIHPSQISVVRRVFAPSKDDLRWAREVLAATGDGSATMVHGQMIDKPLIDHARRLLARADDGR